MNLEKLINPLWKKEYDKLFQPSYLNDLESPTLKLIKEMTKSNVFSSISIQESLATKISNDFYNQNDLTSSAFNKASSFPSITDLVKLNLTTNNFFSSTSIQELLATKISNDFYKQSKLASSALNKAFSFTSITDLVKPNLDTNNFLNPSIIQMMKELENLSSFKALKTLNNAPFDSSIIDLIPTPHSPLEAPLVINEELMEMDHQLAEELSSCNDFNLLSDNSKKILSYIYHEYILQIILGCITAVIMLNIDIIKEELSLISTTQEVKYLTKHGSSNNKFNPNYLKAYRVTIASDLNFREKPSMKSAIITKLPIGTLVEIIDKSKKSWLLVEIEINGEIEEGWIARRYTTYFK